MRLRKSGDCVWYPGAVKLENRVSTKSTPRQRVIRMSLKALVLFFITLLASIQPYAAVIESDSEPDVVVDKYLSATQEQQTAMRGASMQVDIEAAVPKLKSQGKLQALRSISKLGKITYNALGFMGDKMIKNEVIARYLTAETQTQTDSDISISPANYKFKDKGLQDRDGQHVYVLQVSPRKKRVGLFKGEIWVDAQTYMPVREAGKFVKSPSIFLKKMEFERTYVVQNGVSVPQHIESKVETRIFGPVTLSINFTNFSKDAGQDVATTAARMLP